MIVSIAQKRFLSRVFLVRIPFVIVGVMVVSSCEDQILGDGGASIIFPDSLVSFSKHVEPLFTQTCTTSRCHGGSAPAKNLSLDPPSYSSVMNHEPRLVITGESSSSLLVQRLDGTFLPVMPPNRDPLTQNQIKGIKKWIDEGARNN